MISVIRPWPAGFQGRATLTLCVNQRKEEFVASCGRRGAFAIRALLEHALHTQGLQVSFATIACLGLCDKGPNARLAPANSWFHAIAVEDVPELVATVRREIDRLNSMQPGEPHVHDNR